MKEARRKEQNRSRRILATIILVILAGFFLVNLIKRDTVFSSAEDRALMQRPKFTWQGYANGTFEEQFENYETDQFVGRSAFREVDVAFSRVGGAREKNGVILGRKHQLMEDIASPNRVTLSEEIDGINNYALNHPDVSTHIMLVPDAAETLSGQLPMFTTVSDQSKLFLSVSAQLDESIIWMDAESALKNNTDEKLYYQTDSLWTTEGAYRVFLNTASDLNISNPSEVIYDSYCASCTFRGSLARTSGFMPAKKEEIDIYLPEEKTSYLVTYVEEGETVASAYSSEALDTDDQYDVFLGGDYSLIQIDTGADSGRTLLVIKDSFANCYIPFLIPYFSRIIVADPAYYDGSIDNLTSAYGVTDTLFLYGGNSFFTDEYLGGFLSTSVSAD